jgi:hypothetical protein
MAITNITMEEIEKAKLAPGDWVVLADRDMWPATVNGQRLGQITRIQKYPKSPLHAEIQLKPLVNLETLREVMVVTGQQTAQPKPQAQPQQPQPRITPVTNKNDKPKTSAKPAG